VEPFEFGGVAERVASRRFAVLTLLPVAIGVPLIPAFSLASGTTAYGWAVFLIWAIGAVPAFLVVIVVAARPRLRRVIAGMAIVEVLLIFAAYIIVLAIRAPQ
jgi:hypothetical protein